MSSPICNSTVDFQARFNKRQEAVVAAFSKIGYRVMYSSDGIPKINRDRKEIYIPMLKEDSLPSVIKTIRGWVDHEMAHEICDSQTKYLEKAGKTSKSMEMIFRVIEDGRVERLESEMLFGCKENLEANEKVVLEKNKDAENTGIALFLLAKYGAAGVEKYGMKKMLEELTPETIKAVSVCSSCEKAYVASEMVYRDMKMKEKEEAMKEIMKTMKEMAKKMRGDGSGEGDDGGDYSSSEGSEDGSGKKSKKKVKGKYGSGDVEGRMDDSGKHKEGISGKGSIEDGSKSGSSKKSDGKEEEREGKDESGKADSEDSGDSDSSGGDDFSGKEDSEPSDDGEPESDLSESEKRDLERKAEEVAKERVDEKLSDAKDISDRVIDTVRKELEESKISEKGVYIPFTKYDKIMDLTIPANLESVGRRHGSYTDLNDVLKDVNVLSQKLRLELLASKPMRERYKDSGFLDQRRIHLLGMKTGNENVFYSRIKKEGLNTACSLLVDSSGSMMGDNIVLAIKIAYLFSLTFEVLSVPNEVLSFTQDGEGSAPELRGETAGYSRYYPLVHFVHKSFDKKLRHCLDSMKALGSEMMQNADGESVLWAASRLSYRKEKRKILFVISDGMPCNSETGGHELYSHLSEVVKTVGKYGIECVGIGVQTNSVKKFYPNYVVISSLDDVVRGAYSKIVEAIRTAKKTM